MTALPRGSTIGILGGGQLGRMLSVAAAQLGYRVCAFAPPGDNPAFETSASHTAAAYEDIAALSEFAALCDVITYEFENVPVESVSVLEQHAAVYPPRMALEVSQDRVREKTFLNDNGIATARWVSGSDSTVAAAEVSATGISYPGIVKTCRWGYDGKGQVKVSGEGDLHDAWTQLSGQSLIYEEFVPFSQEISVIAARGQDGSMAMYDPGENVHTQGILHTTTVPAGLSSHVAEQACATTQTILEALRYVGVIGVEFFVVQQDGCDMLRVNEFAPRVHNSGHWTLDACAISQFEQHIRAIVGLPLGAPRRHSNAVMTNLIGTDILTCAKLAAESDTCVHDYGKRQPKTGRKMGHVTRISAVSGQEEGG